jgi:starvation-inducible DNA-binding protein
VKRDTAQAHLGALDLVYSGVVGDNRKAIAETGDLDPITEDLLIGQTGELEKFQWFVRAHLENSGGSLSNNGAHSEKQAAAQAR